MGTVSKEIADKIISRDGYYEDDPRVLKIIKYTSKWGTEAYGLLYDQPNRYTASNFIINPQVYWEVEK